MIQKEIDNLTVKNIDKKKIKVNGKYINNFKPSYLMHFGIVMSNVRLQIESLQLSIRFSDDEVKNLTFYTINQNQNIGGLFADYVCINFIPLIRGGKPPTSDKIFILGRHRKITKQGRKNTVIYKGERITIPEAKKIEKRIAKEKANS